MALDQSAPWVQALEIGIGLTTLLGGLIKYLYDKLEKSLNKIRSEAKEAEGITRREHQEVNTQISGMAKDIANNYVRMDSHKEQLAKLQEDAEGIREGVDRVHGRIDTLYQDLLRRKQDGN